jgi:hypothetical protein
VEHRHQALVEPAFAHGDGGALLADHRKVVHRIARNAFQGGDGVGADALVRLRMLGAQAHVAAVHQIPRAVRVGAGGGVGHHLGAAGDHQVFHARHDRGRGHVHRGDARAAEAVEGGGAGLDVIAGVERGHAAEVAALLAPLRGGAPDDVVDLGGVQVIALGDRLQHRGRELLRVDARQGAFAHLADAPRGPACVDDVSVSHGSSRYLIGRANAGAPPA